VLRWVTVAVAVATAAVGPGISIGEARNSEVKGSVLVNGYLLAPPHRQPRLCTALSQAEPPTCLRPTLTVRRLPADERNRLATARLGKTRWSPAPVQILGRVDGDNLRVSSTARA
jgi:hypothetical protein